MILINDIANFGRGRDKQPRKKRNVLIGAISGSAIGAGIGYTTKPSKYDLDAKQRYKNYSKYKKKQISDLNTDKYDFTNNPENKEYLNKLYNDEYSNVVKDKKKLTKQYKLISQLEEIDNFPKVINKRLDRFGKLSNKIGNKRALIGSGVGLAAGLGGAYLYNKLKNDNSK
jgi:hypothetical protein